MVLLDKVAAEVLVTGLDIRVPTGSDLCELAESESLTVSVIQMESVIAELSQLSLVMLEFKVGLSELQGDSLEVGAVPVGLSLMTASKTSISESELSQGSVSAIAGFLEANLDSAEVTRTLVRLVPLRQDDRVVLVLVGLKRA